MSIASILIGSRERVCERNARNPIALFYFVLVASEMLRMDSKVWTRSIKDRRLRFTRHSALSWGGTLPALGRVVDREKLVILQKFVVLPVAFVSSFKT